jgi:hypothetical protein
MRGWVAMALAFDQFKLEAKPDVVSKLATASELLSSQMD